MYFPKGFDLDRAVELGELVNLAYEQFEAFYTGRPWQLPAAYTLKKELTYPRPARKITIQVSSYLDLDLRGLRRAEHPTSKNVPIGFIAQRKNRRYLIVRGTIADQEWLHNLQVRLVPFLTSNYGKVHDGFLRIYNLLQTDILTALEDMDSRQELFIAGHSLGGALATLATADVEVRLGRTAEALYTFGSPRIGDNEFVRAFNRVHGKKSYRILNTSDLVELIPPPAPIAGAVGGYFTHVDTPIGFTIQTDDIVKNHDIKTYLSALREFSRKREFLTS